MSGATSADSSRKSTQSADTDTEVPSQVHEWITTEWYNLLELIMSRCNIVFGTVNLDIHTGMRAHGGLTNSDMHPMVQARFTTAMRCLDRLDFTYKEYRESESLNNSRARICADIDLCVRELREPCVSEDMKVGLCSFLGNLKECLLNTSRKCQEIHFVNLFRSLADLVALNFQHGGKKEFKLAHLSEDKISSVPALVAWMHPMHWLATSKILVIAEVKKSPPPITHDVESMAEDVFTLRNRDRLRSANIAEIASDQHILGQILGEMLGAYEDSAFRQTEYVYAFGVQETKVKLFILHMKEYDFEDPQDALVHENTHSTLYSTKNYDFLKKEDRRDLLQAMGLFASYKFSQSGMI